MHGLRRILLIARPARVINRHARTTTRKNTTRTAAAAYSQKTTTAQDLLKRIATRLAEHQASFVSNHVHRQPARDARLVQRQRTDLAAKG